MTISQTAPVWTEVYNSPQVSLKTLGYLRAQFRNRLHQLILTEFKKKEKHGFTKADLARRIHKKPEQITRLLGAPGNWTLDTVSDLLLGMGGRLAYSFESFTENNAIVGPYLNVISEHQDYDFDIVINGDISPSSALKMGGTPISGGLGCMPKNTRSAGIIP